MILVKAKHTYERGREMSIILKWGKYSNYEGPWTPGTVKYSLPANPTAEDRIMAVITQTEGGSGNAVNMYDRCIISVGYFQWCEASFFLTSKLLGAIATQDEGLLDALRPAMVSSKVGFRRKSGTKWRFFRGSNEVDELLEQQHTFLLNSNGKRGSWDEVSKAHARLWCKCMAECLAQPEADRIQVSYTAQRVRSFATKDAQRVLFDGYPDEKWVGALRAAFLSFAANNPSHASKGLQKAVKSTGAAKWSPDWCIAILKELTFGPRISIYPHRYDKIRPVIERLFEVDLPDFASELKEWANVAPPTDDSEPDFYETDEVQQVLVDMGYDLGRSGPKDDGVDGIWGRKTGQAVEIFQMLAGINEDGVGPETRKALLQAWRDKVCA